MPRLLNPKHEAIALSLSKGASQGTAYKDAYGVKDDKAARTAAWRLLKHVRWGAAIRARRDELISLDQGRERQLLDFADDAPLSKSWILRQYMAVVSLARSENNLAAMNKALEMLGKEIGMFKDKKPGDRSMRLEDLTLEDIERLISTLEADPQVQAGMAETSVINRDDSETLPE